jgi:WD40 repeat protein
MNITKNLKRRNAYLLFCCIVLLLVFTLPVASIVQAQDVQPLLKVSTDYDFTHVFWSLDGELIAVGEPNGTVIFNTSLEEITHMTGDGIVSLTWNPQSTQLATGGGFYSHQGEVQIWQRDMTANTFALVTTFHNSHENVRYLVWSPDGTMLATASRDSREGLEPIVFTIEIWNTDNWTLKTTLKHQYLYGTDNLSWSPDSTRIAGGGTEYGCNASDCSPAKSGVYIADVETGDRLFFLGEDYPSSLDWSKNNLLAVNRPTLAVYNPNTGEPVHTDTYAAGRIKWHPGGVWLANISASDRVNINNPQTEDFAFSVIGEPELWDMDWNPDGKRLVAVTESGTIQIWDTSSLVNTATATAGHD